MRMLFSSVVRRSFGLQLSARVVLIVVASNLMLLAGLGSAFLYGMGRSQEAEAATVARLLATALETPLLEANYAEVTDMVREAVALNELGHVRVRLADGTHITEAGQLYTGRWAPPLHETESRFGQQTLGRLTVQMGHSQLGDTLPGALLALCLSLILSLGIAYALFHRFARRTKSRIHALKQATESFARGDLTACAVVAGEDELAEFGREFDRAMREIAGSQDELRHALLAAESANVAKSRFLATISHEIRTPLNGVLGMAQLLIAGPVGEEETREYARTILHSGQTLLTLLNDILDLSKIEAGKMTLVSERVVPADIVRESANLFAQTAQANKIDLHSQWRGDAAQHYRGDPHRLRQMLSNLVNNAIKFTAQGSVRIEAAEIAHDGLAAVLEFSVSDTGVGIPADQQDRLFKPFSQIDDSATRQHGGSGLGLSIVRHLAQLMNGEVGVDSAPGRGSRFWFRVRLERLAAQGDNRALPRVASPSVAGAGDAPLTGRVLVVEDNLTNRIVIDAMLKKMGIATVTAENGEEALGRVMAEADRIDVILMDVQMPVLDGYQATGSIRDWEQAQQRTPLPIIALTADAFPEDRARCLAAGMDDYLSKPVHVNVLADTLKKWLKADSRRSAEWC